jgi:hypothetical protein
VFWDALYYSRNPTEQEAFSQVAGKRSVGFPPRPVVISLPSAGARQKSIIPDHATRLSGRGGVEIPPRRRETGPQDLSLELTNLLSPYGNAFISHAFSSRAWSSSFLRIGETADGEIEAPVAPLLHKRPFVSQGIIKASD